MNRDDLIQDLTKEGNPVSALPPPWLRFFRWLVVVFFCLAVGVLFLGLRDDLESASARPSFQIHGVLTMILGLASSLSAFLLSVPGSRSRKILWIPLMTLILFFVYFGYSLYFLEHDPFQFGWGCIRDILVLAFVPGAILLFLLRRAAVLDGWKTSFFAFLGLGALGSLGTQFICHNDGALHTLLWHYLPVLVLGILGSYLGNRILGLSNSRNYKRT